MWVLHDIQRSVSVSHFILKVKIPSFVMEDNAYILRRAFPLIAVAIAQYTAGHH